MADYRTEDKSKYEICSVIGWPFETGAALARLVFSGIMDRFPDLKVISHHLGGIIPYFEGRVAHSWDQLGARTSDEDYSLILKRLKKRPFDYFKGFYGDTALAGARAPTICGLSFFGAGPRAVRLRLPVRQGKGPGLHPLDHRGAWSRSTFRRPIAKRFATGTPSPCSGCDRVEPASGSAGRNNLLASRVKERRATP